MRQITDAGAIEFPSLSDAGLSLAVASDAGWADLPGHRNETSYVVPNVPLGRYRVRQGDSFYLNSIDNLDIGWTTRQRRDVDVLRDGPQDGGSTTLTLHTAGLGAWGENDDLLFYSAEAALYGRLGDGALLEGPVIGETPSKFSFDYSSLFGTPRQLDTRQGDVLWVGHLRNMAIADGGTFPQFLECAVLQASARVENLTVQGAQENVASIAFAKSRASEVRAVYPGDAWEARAPETHPAARIQSREMWYTIESEPYDSSPDMIWCSNIGGSDLTWQVATTVDDPFPTDLRRTFAVRQVMSIANRDGDAGVWFARGYVESNSTPGGALLPGVHAPIDLTIQGVPAFDLTSLSAQAPLDIDWRPSPQMPPADDFVIELWRIRATGGRQRIAWAITDEAPFTFPPELLQPGFFYYVIVRARVNAATRERPLDGVTESSADSVSTPVYAQ